MSAQESNVLARVLLLLQEERGVLCVDGDSSYQRGFFSGYDCALRIVESIARDCEYFSRGSSGETLEGYSDPMKSLKGD